MMNNLRTFNRLPVQKKPGADAYVLPPVDGGQSLPNPDYEPPSPPETGPGQDLGEKDDDLAKAMADQDLQRYTGVAGAGGGGIDLAGLLGGTVGMAGAGSGANVPVGNLGAFAAGAALGGLRRRIPVRSAMPRGQQSFGDQVALKPVPGSDAFDASAGDPQTVQMILQLLRSIGGGQQ